MGISPFLKRRVDWATPDYSNLPRSQPSVALKNINMIALAFFVLLMDQVFALFLEVSFGSLPASRRTSRSHPLNMKLQTLLVKAWGAQRI